MMDLLEKLLETVEFGKVDKKSRYPPQFKDQDGSYELTLKAIEEEINPRQILDEALIPAMGRVGKKFSAKQIFVPQMLMSAKAMAVSIAQLKPYFTSGAVKTKGIFIIGTVKGDLHDIGKNLVSMMVEGSGWSIIDLGVDVSPERFIEVLENNRGAVIGLSALLTTTMDSMKKTVADIKAESVTTKILVGGAPVTQDFCNKIGADFYSPDPQGAVNYLDHLLNNKAK